MLTILYRALKDKVEKLESEKVSHANHIFDLRQLLQKVNTNGESKVEYLKNKNVSLYISLIVLCLDWTQE